MVRDKAQEDWNGERRDNRASPCPLPPFPESRLTASENGKHLGDEVRFWRESFEVPAVIQSHVCARFRHTGQFKFFGKQSTLALRAM